MRIRTELAERYRYGVIVATAAALCVLLGCISSSGKAYAIKATVSGLKGTGLVLQLNGGHDTTVTADGEVTLAYMVSGYHYSVSVKTQPTSPAQTCAVDPVDKATGTMGSADVTGVPVVCRTTYGIGGAVSGLEGTGLVLNNRLGDDTVGEDLSISGDGAFVFPTRAAAQTEYVVSVKTPPTGPDQTCSVDENASGTVVDSDILNVKVTCSTNAYKVGGKVKDLAAGTTVVLRNNGVDLPVPNNNATVSDVDFSFMVADGAAYAVTVETQPTNPWQECTVGTGTGSGRVNGQDVTTVGVTCKINSYAIGGSVSGLVGSGLVLTTNGQNVTVNAGSSVFIFETSLASGTNYEVTVANQPTNPPQTCTVTNGSGKIEGAPVTDIVVGCPVPMVAVGNGVTASSQNGTTWTAKTIAGDYQAVSWNGSVFAAVGFSSACATSPDGITWTSRDIPTGPYRAISWNGSVFAAVGSSVAATSPDGITWTSGTITSGYYEDVSWNGSVFAAVGNSVAATSPDGVTWTSRTIPAEHYYAVSWNGSVFAAVGSKVAATSPDGNTWTSRTITSDYYNAVSWNGFVFTAVGNSVAATSPDGVTWTSRTIPAGNYNAVSWNGSVFAAVGSNVAATSPDGITWTSRTIPSGSYRGITSSW